MNNQKLLQRIAGSVRGTGEFCGDCQIPNNVIVHVRQKVQVKKEAIRSISREESIATFIENLHHASLGFYVPVYGRSGGHAAAEVDRYNSDARIHR